ncbi:hypothetical protein [Maribacter sp. 2210JD10-5]|uniref:hypothetical protein n=1 Tax=Maribacter sp. 2210JD10-5 TaxID=3386272 RepID=UPI0039BC7376
MKSKIVKYTPIILLLVSSTNLLAQNHRYDRYDGPRSLSLGVKCLLIGGVVWGIGMLLGRLLKKDENGTISDGQKTGTGIVGFFVIIGALIAGFGLIMLGF